MVLDPNSFMAGAGVVWAVAMAGRWIERCMRRAWDDARTELIAAQDRMITDQATTLARAAIVIGQLLEDAPSARAGWARDIVEKWRMN